MTKKTTSGRQSKKTQAPPMKLERLIWHLLEREGREDLDRLFLGAAGRKYPGESLNEVSKHRGCYPEFNKRGLQEDADYVNSLAECIHRMRLSLNDMAHVIPSPWDRLQPGSTVLLVVGSRPVQRIDQGQTDSLVHYAVGKHDMEAVAHIQDYILHYVQPECSIELRSLCADAIDGRKGRVQCFNALLDACRGGALIAIGSPVVNPITDLVAEIICYPAQGAPKPNGPSPGLAPPTRFAWPSDVAERLKASFLSADTSDYQHNEIGILFGNNPVIPSRTPDRDILKSLASNAWREASFSDCGILMVDASKERRFLAFCAGHGGKGTLATAHALTSRKLGRFVEHSYSFTGQASDTIGIGAPWHLGSGRVVQVVISKWRKPTDRPIDDLVMGEDIDSLNSWDFHLKSHHLIDVLDEYGSPTGLIMSRSEVHECGAWHRTVHIILLDSEGNILLQRRGDTRPWDISVAGHVDYGETPLETAVRETLEEVDLKLSPDRFHAIRNPLTDDGAFVKIGARDFRVEETRHDATHDVFRYCGRDTANNERCHLFVVRLQEEEQPWPYVPNGHDRLPNGEALGCEAFSPNDLVHDAANNPAEFASSLLQYLQHPLIGAIFRDPSILAGYCQ